MISKDISSVNEATQYISNLSLHEKKFILEAIKTEFKKKDVKEEVGSIENITSKQVKQLIIFNVFPFIGFGILDNMILIVAGQWINTTFGVILGISTMAAAALGNILSDIAGVGLSYYVELGVRKLGIHQPTLLREQAESRKVRYIVNCSRAIGLTIGCLIGMFPLLFFNEK
uniref:Transmembrane protein 65 n=1 Tax=Panagrolaimus sp. ES5 TaxID=591445 RepID=A0AC34G5M3_9BILA